MLNIISGMKISCGKGNLWVMLWILFILRVLLVYLMDSGMGFIGRIMDIRFNLNLCIFEYFLYFIVCK